MNEYNYRHTWTPETHNFAEATLFLDVPATIKFVAYEKPPELVSKILCQRIASLFLCASPSKGFAASSTDLICILVLWRSSFLVQMASGSPALHTQESRPNETESVRRDRRRWTKTQTERSIQTETQTEKEATDKRQDTRTKSKTCRRPQTRMMSTTKRITDITHKKKKKNEPQHTTRKQSSTGVFTSLLNLIGWSAGRTCSA